MDRRQFIKNASIAGSYVLWIGPSLSQATNILGGPADGFFTVKQREVLGIICNGIFPGAAEMGAVNYIETLLTAFDSNPPKIYAGGPYSGRNQEPGSDVENEFKNFLPLNRFQEAAWKIQLYGSNAFPSGIPNEKIVGKKKGLRKLFSEEVKFVSEQMSLTSADSALSMTSEDFKDTVRDLTIEACFSAPEYGGNKNLQGWAIVRFPGDSAPYGFSHYDETTGKYYEDAKLPVSGPDATNPDPLDDTRGMLKLITIFKGGRKYY